MTKSLLCAGLLAVSVLTVLPASAGNLNGNQASGVSAVISVYTVSFIAASPVLLVAKGSQSVREGSKRTKPDTGKAVPLPPMAVQQIDRQPDGGFHVALQRPDAPDATALIDWPARADNPAATLKVGDVLHFEPTEVGAGWTVTAADGEALALLPTPDAAAGHSSERW